MKRLDSLAYAIAACCKTTEHVSLLMVQTACTGGALTAASRTSPQTRTPWSQERIHAVLWSQAIYAGGEWRRWRTHCSNRRSILQLHKGTGLPSRSP